MLLYHIGQRLCADSHRRESTVEICYVGENHIKVWINAKNARECCSIGIPRCAEFSYSECALISYVCTFDFIICVINVNEQKRAGAYCCGIKKLAEMPEAWRLVWKWRYAPVNSNIFSCEIYNKAAQA